MADTDAAHADNVEVEHEQSDVNVRAIVAVAVGLLVTALVVHLVVYGVFVYFENREARQPEREYPLAAIEAQLPRPPRIQPSPAEDLKDLRKQEDEALSSYALVDEKIGIARIPIDRAMQLIVERGLPVRAQQSATDMKR